eukprot:symbB.v1.2.024467.t1/scaffold2266.1/size83935/10
MGSARCHQDAYGHNVVAQLAGEKLWLLFHPSSVWLGAHRLPFEDSSTFTDVDPLSDAECLPAECRGLRAVLHPGDVLIVPRHWFHAVQCNSDWSLSLNQWLDALGDTEQRVQEAVTRCIASPFLEGRRALELLDTKDNIEYLTSALEVQMGCEVPTTAVHAALLRAATRPEVISTIAGLVRTELRSKKTFLCGVEHAAAFDWRSLHLQMYCEQPFSAESRRPGLLVRLRHVPNARIKTCRSELDRQPTYCGLVAAAVAGGRRMWRQRRQSGLTRLQRYSAVLEPHQRSTTEVLIDFDTLVNWLVDMERRRGKDVPRTYRSLDRRVSALQRRLRARGVELCFIVADKAASCCKEPEDAHLWLAEEQIRASLARSGCRWKHCGDGSCPTDTLSRHNDRGAVLSFRRFDFEASFHLVASSLAMPRRRIALLLAVLAFTLLGSHDTRETYARGSCFLGSRRGILLGPLLGTLSLPMSPASAESIIKQMASESRRLSDALKSGKPVVVDFAADWCPDCQQIAPVLLELKQQVGKDIEFVTMDVSYAAPGSTLPRNLQNDFWARKLGVDGLPHVAFIDSQRHVQTALVGDVPANVVRADVEALIKGAEMPFIMFGVGMVQLSTAVIDWVVGSQGTADVQNEALERLAALADEAPQHVHLPSNGTCKASSEQLDGLFKDGGPAFHRQAQGSSGMEESLLELASLLRQREDLLDEVCGLPMQARAWLLERALRTASLSDNWLEEWVQVADKLVARFGSQPECNLDIQEHGLAASATSLLARSAPLMEEELEALAWTLELMKPRRQPTAFSNSMIASLDQILDEIDELQLDERAAAVAITFQDILRGAMHLCQILALEKPWLMEPRECFDDLLFRKLLLALKSGANLRQRLGGRAAGLRRPGRKSLSSAADGAGNASLAATRGARLARLLISALPLASDDERDKEEKMADLILREEELLLLYVACGISTLDLFTCLYVLFMIYMV